MAGMSRALVAIAGLMVLGGMVTSTLLSTGRDAVRERLEAFVAASAQENLPSRPVAWGETLVGVSALECYQQADEWFDVRLRAAPPCNDPDDVARVGIVTAVCRGAHAPCRGPVRCRWRPSFLVGQVLEPEIERRWSVDPPAAAELLLDVLTFLLDSDGAEYANMLLRTGTNDRLAQLDGATAERLAAGLEVVDARWLTWSSKVDLLRSATIPRLAATERTFRLSAWRHVFDTEQAERAACAALLEALPELEPAATDWSARDAQWQALFVRCADFEGTKVVAWFEQVRGSERRSYEMLTRLRLLRLALARLHGEPLPTLGDPFADAPLQIEPDAEGLTFRSAASSPRLERRVP